ncbi:sensor histidine kinase [Actinokineospora sp.]|uniref:sensor histidine kinase n=1 Tax=Actinokineospora sp. TaxID=1872133 RepID=UPI003D6ADC28
MTTEEDAASRASRVSVKGVVGLWRPVRAEPEGSNADAPDSGTAATPGAARHDRPPGRQWVVPARIRIMGWLLLLMVMALATVALVTRNMLLRQVDGNVATALEQEAREFSGVAAAGVDRATNRPIGSARELLFNHLQRQYPDEDEVLVGWVANTGDGEVLHQQRLMPLPLHQRPELFDTILVSANNHGSTRTDAGEMRWVKVAVAGPSAAAGDRGIFVVGYFVAGDQAKVDQTIRTLALVSLAGLLLGGFAAWLVAGQILAPVRLLHHAATQIGEHDLTRRIPVTGHDDIARLADQFNEMLDRLQEAFDTQRHFVDDAGHELRTPITIIRGHLELMGEDPADRAAVIRLCTDELDRMNRIVADLLVLAKAERPDFIQPATVELIELTSDLDAKVRALGDRRWRLEAIGEGRVVLDPQRVTQAVVQLAQNAVQHTADGDEIRLGSALYNGAVSFWITDQGPGVSSAETERIFERFARSSTRGGTGQRTGAGLGLAIVKAIAEAHGGTTRLMSKPGKGATFGIELPIRQGSAR